MRPRTVDADLEPQHLVPARDPEQPVDRVLDLGVVRVEQAALRIAKPLVVIAERDDRMAQEVIEHDQRQQARQVRSRRGVPERHDERAREERGAVRIRQRHGRAHRIPRGARRLSRPGRAMQRRQRLSARRRQSIPGSRDQQVERSDDAVRLALQRTDAFSEPLNRDRRDVEWVENDGLAFDLEDRMKPRVVTRKRRLQHQRNYHAAARGIEPTGLHDHDEGNHSLLRAGVRVDVELRHQRSTYSSANEPYFSSKSFEAAIAASSRASSSARRLRSTVTYSARSFSTCSERLFVYSRAQRTRSSFNVMLTGRLGALTSYVRSICALYAHAAYQASIATCGGLRAPSALAGPTPSALAGPLPAARGASMSVD